MEITTYTEKIDKLFANWKTKKNDDGTINHCDNVFIRDGVVDPKQWFSQAIRPLYLLKEAYNGNEDWNLCEDHLLQTDKKMSQMWYQVCQWTEGLMNTTCESIYKYPASLADDYYGNDILKRIAVVNVKKSNGKRRSSLKEIDSYAEYDRKELREEIELCDPTIIVCGYTIRFLNTIFKCKVKDYEHPNDSWIYNVRINDHDVIVLDYFHPANQWPNLMNYYGLMGIYQQALLQR